MSGVWAGVGRAGANRGTRGYGLRVDLLVVVALEQHGEAAAAAADLDRVGDEDLVTRTPCLRVGVHDLLAALKMEGVREVPPHRIGELGNAVGDDDHVERNPRRSQRFDRPREVGTALIVQRNDDCGARRRRRKVGAAYYRPRLAEEASLGMFRDGHAVRPH